MLIQITLTRGFSCDQSKCKENTFENVWMHQLREIYEWERVLDTENNEPCDKLTIHEGWKNEAISSIYKLGRWSIYITRSRYEACNNIG